MKKNEPYEVFVNALREKIPERGKLTGRLMDILELEKEAIYRRLRNDVPFSFHEVVEIACALGISLDSMKNIHPDKSRPFDFSMVDYYKLTEEDYHILEQLQINLHSFRNDPEAEIGCTLNTLPLLLFPQYDEVFKFFYFKWLYQDDHYNFSRLYHELALPPRLREVNHAVVAAAQEVEYTYYIWDKLAFYHMAKDIKYFADIDMIAREDVEALKEELFRMIDDIERTAVTGTFPSGKKVDHYVSDVNFETSYIHIKSSLRSTVRVKVLTLHYIWTKERETLKEMYSWMQLLKNTSTLISGAGELDRVKFFNQQRQYIAEI